jgi:hydroxyacylglutathione hydrolase
VNAVDTVAVHRIVTGPLAANCYVVSSLAGDAVVVDPGGDAEAIAEHVEANGLRPHAVLGTHGHYDHVGALAELVERYGVPFGIHSAESDALMRVNFCRFAFHGLGRVAIPDVDLDLARFASLSFGDLEIAVVHTPGHSPGGVCFEVAGMLLTGDTLMATHLGTADMPGSDLATLEDSARRLAREYPLDTVIHPGHGAPGRLGAAIAGRAPSLEPRA